MSTATAGKPEFFSSWRKRSEGHSSDEWMVGLLDDWIIGHHQSIYPPIH
jgi:hypothetical protein